ncbi:unnamed protein product [Timema podura]|uniref:Uncharacterized protein n=1 Tax=Timema podura TaxID=61482 RepID=A0ABN7NEJ6_TIMPD|nr:unnamed protein product [Timema podura]
MCRACVNGPQSTVQEQPLLLEELLEQEKREQEKQQHHQGPDNAPTAAPLLSDVDFERLRADILSTSTPTGGSPGLGSPHLASPPQGIPVFYINNFYSSITKVKEIFIEPRLGIALVINTHNQWRYQERENALVVNINTSVKMIIVFCPEAQGLLPSPNTVPVGSPLRPPFPPRPAVQPQPKVMEWQQPGVVMENKMGPTGVVARHPSTTRPPPQVNTVAQIPLFNAPVLPAPQLPPENIETEQDRQIQLQYEQWLNNQNQIVTQQLKYYETEINKLRKARKSLNSKQRQLRKAGNELAEPDALELQRISSEQAVLQKQLEASRKQSKQHGLLMQEYHNKQIKQRQMSQGSSPGSVGLRPGQGQPSHSPLGLTGSSPGHHPSTPQSPMPSPSPSPLHSPGPLLSHSPGLASLIQHSPGGMSPHSLQPSPRMGTPHSQIRIWIKYLEENLRFVSKKYGIESIPLLSGTAM